MVLAAVRSSADELRNRKQNLRYRIGSLYRGVEFHDVDSESFLEVFSYLDDQKEGNSIWVKNTEEGDFRPPDRESSEVLLNAEELRQEVEKIQDLSLLARVGPQTPDELLDEINEPNRASYYVSSKAVPDDPELTYSVRIREDGVVNGRVEYGDISETIRPYYTDQNFEGALEAQVNPKRNPSIEADAVEIIKILNG